MSRFAMDWSELSLQVMITFAHFVWQACVVGFVMFVAQHIGESLRVSQILHRRRSAKSSVSLGETDLRGANFRYAIACFAFFSLPICVAATFTWVHQSRGSIFLTANNPIEALVIPAASENRSNPQLPSNGVQALSVPEIPVEPLLTSRSQLPFVEPIAKPVLTIDGTTRMEFVQLFAPFLLIAYAIGVALMLTRFGISIVGSSRLRRTLQPITDSNLVKIIVEQSLQLGLKRVPIVAICQRVSVPVVVGIVKPMILLPSTLLCGLDPNQLTAILSHEMAHIRRYDLIVNLLQRIVEALLFFHPVTWWISRRVSVERESCCDDVAAACAGRLSYASALLQMAELCVHNDRRRMATLASLSAAGGSTTDLGYRIRRLIGAEETTRVGVSRRSIAIGLAMISLLTVSFVAWGQSQKQAEDGESEDKAMTDIFTPEPLWKTKLSANDVAPETLRISPVVVAGKRILSIEKDFDLSIGKEIDSAFERIPRKNVLDMTFDPVFRRKSSDRDFVVEVSVRGLGNGWDIPSHDIRILRATDGKQVGTTIHSSRLFDGITGDVDVENGGDFLLVGMGNDVHVYRTETGAIESKMPVKTKRIDAVAMSPDRKWLVVSDQNDLHFWRWRDQAPVKTIHAGRKIDSLVFTADGQYLAEGPDTREDIQIRDMRTLEIIASLKDEIGSPLMVSSMDITPDGRYLVAHNEVSVDQTKLTIPHRIHVWDLKERGKPVFQIATGEWVRSVAFSDNGSMVVGEFRGAAHGALLAAWQLPDELLDRKVDSPRDAKDRLGDGIQWSRWGDENGLLSGARLILPEGGLKPGQPLVVEYRLANVSKEKKTLKCYLNKGMQFTSLSYGNRIGGFGLDWHREPVTLNIEPGEVFVDTEHLVSIDTTGLEPGEYQVALGSAFHYPDDVELNTTHEIPHRGSMPFTITGKSTLRTNELPKSDIHWGSSIAGLQIGARFLGDPKAIAIGESIEAELFVANVTSQPIECSVAVPHISHDWHFSVVDSNGGAIKLDGPFPLVHSPYTAQRVIPFTLAPGEISPITVDGLPMRTRPSLATSRNAKLSLAWPSGTDLAGSATWPKHSIYSLMTQGGAYSATFHVILMRPDFPSIRLELDSGNVPFSVKSPDENPISSNELDEETDKRTADRETATVAENPANGQNTGAIKGRITLDGVVPKHPKLRVPTPTSPRLTKRPTDEARKEYEASLVEIDDESIQVDADQGLANAFVYLAKAPSNWQPTQEDLKPFTLTIQDYRFTPRAAIVRTGQDVRLNNSSVDADNFAFEPMKNDGQNLAVGARTEITLEHPFTIPERTPVQAKSHIHPWKAAFLLPLDHPFAAITDSHGNFSIEGLPPGEHSFAIWHESVGWLEKSFVVRIEPGQTTSTDRAFSVDRFQSAQQPLLQKGRELSGKRKDLVQRIDSAANQRDQAKRYSSDFYRLDHTLKNQELLLAKFDLENATANLDVPNAPQATPERIAELRELLRIRWGLAVDGIQLGLGMIGDRSEFEPSEKISFQVYIRNATEERIAQKLRWFDAANSTSLLRCLAGSPNNIFLSIRSGSSPGQETELHLEPGEIRELPRGRFEMDTAGLHPGVYSVDANFPVVFPNQAGESATKIARPIDSDGTPFELLFHFELIGDQSPLDVIPPDTASEIIGTSQVKWGTPVFGLQAGARFRNDETISGEIGTAGAALPRSSIKHHTHIGDTVKTELLVRNISNQPIEVRFQPAMGKEIQSLSAMESALTEISSRAIMRRSPVEAVEKSTQTIERTIQPGEHFIVAHQDFEIQQLVNGRERQPSLPEANRHWVPGHGDYMYRAYLKLGITDSLSVSLHSGGIEIQIIADDIPLASNQRQTSETNVSSSGEPNMNGDLKEIFELIAVGKTIPQEFNDKYQAVHLKLTAAERLKSVKLLAVPDFVMQDVLSEPTYSLEEKIALLSELKDRNFGKLEFGMQECMANLATEYAQTDPAATREWLAQFQGAEYGVGMGLTAVLKATKQKDPATSLEILRSLSDAEGECIVTCGDIPKYELPASEWLKEVQQFKSHALRSCFLGGPMVFHFGEESPEAALGYILSIPKETRTPQLGYQLVGCVLRSKRFTWTEILDWMETKLPIETRSPEHYGLLADTWSQQDDASFQLWFQGLKDPVIRDEAIRGIQAVGQPQDWAAMLALAQQITDQTKRQSKIAWVLNAWKLTDPSAALAQLDTADVSKERRTQLHRDITARLKQVGNSSGQSPNH